MLTKHFYWHRDKDPKKYTDEQIHALFERSLEVDPMDGERAELHFSKLRYALAAAGDEHFASLLENELAETQKAVAEFMGWLISTGGLSYPQTDSLLKKIQESSTHSTS